VVYLLLGLEERMPKFSSSGCLLVSACDGSV
jgi:hypothetical protein